MINPSKALYIKLGRTGSWETESLKEGILRFDCNETPYEAAKSGDWDTVKEYWTKFRQNVGTATKDVTQARNFFEASEDTLWITYSSGYLWWCFAKPGVKKHPDGGGHYRDTLGGWSKTDIHGKELTMDKLSGNLLKLQAYRGTICKATPFDYLIRKVNGQLLPEVQEAANAEAEMISKLVPLMKLLTWQDFELLVDLVFSSSGWRRIGQVGKTQKTVDLELMLPSTAERAFVQIKSSTNKKDLEECIKLHRDSAAYDRMFFVWHSGNVGDLNDEDDIVLIPPDRLAKMVFDAGLSSWLREKVS